MEKAACAQEDIIGTLEKQIVFVMLLKIILLILMDFVRSATICLRVLVWDSLNLAYAKEDFNGTQILKDAFAQVDMFK